ncbi:hypothetical protein IPM19_03980 [bacterium]|nr:MAG: hypothetical protein IPM19_03980 [bacterium]
MNNTVAAIVTGFLFAWWPLMMQRTNLSSFWQGAVFSAFVTVSMVIPAVLNGTASWQNADWKFAIIAGVSGALGMVVFTSMLSSSTPIEIGPLLTTMLITQVAVAAIYHAVVNGEVSSKKIVGFVLTGVVVYLLK